MAEFLQACQKKLSAVLAAHPCQYVAQLADTKVRDKVICGPEQLILMLLSCVHVCQYELSHSFAHGFVIQFLEPSTLAC
jgi:hypothetical protein